MTFEDRIETAARVVLLGLLLATLGWVGQPRAQSTEAKDDNAPLILVAWRPGELQEELRRGIWFVLESDSELVMRKSTEGLWEELVKRFQRRASII